jgi:7-cyano-7-deazaguanine synthase
MAARGTARYAAPVATRTKKKRLAVCLLSGGMDSAVAAAEAKAAGFATCALTLRYGQRHAAEVAAAERVARALAIAEHRVVDVDLRALGGSALTGAARVPKGRSSAEIGRGVPATYVPARNTILLAIALGWAESLGSTDLFLGVNALDYSGYPDCRPEFLRAFEALAALATAAGTETGAAYRIHAPLQQLSKAQIVLRAEELGVDLALTHTCYDPVVQEGLRGGPPEESTGGSGSDVLACGRCDACQLRLRGFREAGRIDPLRYAR